MLIAKRIPIIRFARPKVDIDSLGDWETAVPKYLANLREGLESINAAPQINEERQEIFELQKQDVNTLVKGITIDQNLKLRVEKNLNLLRLLKKQ